MKKFQGVWPALVTPFTEDDRVNTSVLKDLVDHFIEKRVAGFYICGSTGQGLFMSVEERKLVTETVIDHVDSRVPVVVHVGSFVISNAVELAQHAQQVGAAGISSIVPAYFDEPEAIYQYYEKIANSVPELPLWPYFWSRTQHRFGLIKRLIQIPSVIALKYTGPNMYELRQIIELKAENWTVFSGMDEQCVFAAMFGASGCIGTTINIFPGVYQKIYQHVAANETAQAINLQNQANRIITTMYNYNFRGALAEMMYKQGFDCGRPRLPHRPMRDDERQPLWNELESLSYQELVSMRPLT